MALLGYGEMGLKWGDGGFECLSLKSGKWGAGRTIPKEWHGLKRNTPKNVYNLSRHFQKYNGTFYTPFLNS